MNSLLKKLFPLQVFKKLHLGTVSFGTESFPEVKEHLVNEYNNGTKQGTKVRTGNCCFVHLYIWSRMLTVAL